MKKIILLSLICLPVFTNAINPQSLNDSENCKLRGFNILAYGSYFKYAFDTRLKEFGAMKSTDFDEDGCINDSNLYGGVVTADFSQKKIKLSVII
ncbi:hypothetical protein F985_02742 [Acinetobacter seifertii]|uniref:Uncharacterized protein n=1 Tax=Acinetobacter seifertii TaxID=1530123 RepID=N8QTB8_9GAMM|nr:hypothetical protein [Acinetobacter seifertii]ENU41855.1 hypothetical protein F985_02742 [Acinetobacter seifertii]